MHEIIASQPWLFRLLGGTSGLLLMLPHIYPVLAPLQLVALLPILYVLASDKTSTTMALEVGLYMALVYILPQILLTRLPLLFNVILIFSFSFVLILFTICSRLLMRGPAVIGAFGVGALLVVLDWFSFTIMSLWGTAQSLVRPWSHYPYLIQFISVTGITGIIFFLGSFQALIIKICIHPKNRIQLLYSTIALVCFLLFFNLYAYPRTPTSSLKVAALGWTTDHVQEVGGMRTPEGFDTLFADPVAQAAEEGARLIVTPELGFNFGNFNFIIDGNRDWFEAGRKWWFERFQKEARKHRLFLAIGYYHSYDQENRLLFMNPQGSIISEYTKTHLLPFSLFKPGRGELVMIDVDGIPIGGMICHDDNFTDISRGYGRNDVPIVAVPTLDWEHVKDIHFQSSIFRAIESHYAVIRAASNGISAIIAPTGKILAIRDHFDQGPGFISAEVPLYSQKTPFSIYGHWPVYLSAVFLLFLVIRQLLKLILMKRVRG